jgi:Major tropism determinant N-terminal domain
MQMAQTIQFRRGNEANLPSLVPGEPAYTVDTDKLFVGSPNGNVEIGKKDNLISFGAKGDGTDATNAVLKGLTADIETIGVPKGTFTFKEINLDKNVRFVGLGISSVLKMPTDLGVSTLGTVGGIAGKSNTMFLINSPVTVVFENITFDGDYFNQTEVHNGGTFLKIYKPTLASGEMIHVTFKNCRFINNNYSTILSYGSGKRDRIFINVLDCVFGGGAKGTTQTAIPTKWSQGYSPNYMNIIDGATVHVHGNKFIDPIVPNNTTEFGREGIKGTVTDTSSIAASDLLGSSFFISRNVFENLGRNAASPNGIGVIDFYVNGEDVVVTDNRFVNSQMQSIRAKANVKNLVVKGNIIEGGIDGAISIQPNNYASKKCNAIIANNIVERTHGYGVLVSGDTDTDGIPYFDNVVVKGNVFKDIRLANYSTTYANGVNLERVKNAIIDSNEFIDIGLDIVVLTECEDVTVSNNIGNTVSADETMGRGVQGTVLRGSIRVVNNTLSSRNTAIYLDFDNVASIRSVVATGNHLYKTLNATSQAIYIRDFLNGAVTGNIVEGLVSKVGSTAYGYNFLGTLLTLANNVYYDGVDQSKAIKLKTNVTTLKESNNTWN